MELLLLKMVVVQVLYLLDQLIWINKFISGDYLSYAIIPAILWTIDFYVKSDNLLVQIHIFK